MHSDETIAEAQPRLHLIVQSDTDQFWIKDIHGRYVVVSTTLAEQYQLDPASMLGRTAEELIPYELCQIIAEEDRKVYLTGKTSYKERLINLESGPTWYELSRSPIHDAQGNIAGILGIARDIHDRKVAEATAQRQLRYAQTLAICSRNLLVSESAAELTEHPSAIIRETLEQLRETIAAQRIYVYRYINAADAAPNMPGTVLIAESHDPMLSAHQPMVAVPPEKIPDRLLNAIRTNQCVHGPIAELSAGYPEYQAYFEQNQIASLLLIPIFIGGKPWGHVSVADIHAEQVWDEHVIQLMRTASDMLGAFVQRRETAIALAQREAYLRALYNAIPDILMVAHRNGYFTNVHSQNPSDILIDPYQLIGLSFEQIAELPIVKSSFAAQKLRHTFVEKWNMLWDTGQIQFFEYQLELNATIRSFEARLTRINDESAMILIRDITEQTELASAMRSAKEDAESAARAKSEFLSHMSHEIRTPLNSVIGMAQLLQGTDLSSEQRNYAEIIHLSGETLLGIVNNILDLSRIESGRIELEQRTFALHTCVESAIALMSQAAAQKQLSLTCDIIAPKPLLLIGDEIRLRQMILNLVANALKFTEQGHVAIRAVANTKDQHTYLVRIMVEDTGIGLDAHELEQIFEPFTQANRSTTRRYGGTGLGLTISRRFAALMGGAISAHSIRGVGSVFTIEVPLPAVRSHDDHSHQVGGRDLFTDMPLAPPVVTRLLIAEDNPINQLVIRRMLDRLGYQADIVNNGEEAYQAILQQQHRVVLMDVQMPIRDGEQTTRDIRSLGQHIPQPYIIALTANALESDRDRYLGAGMNDYLSKPIRIDELKRAIDLALQAIQ